VGRQLAGVFPRRHRAMEEETSLLTVKEVAERLKCSTSQVYAIKQQGKLRSYKIGGMVRFRREDVEEYIDSCVVEVTLEPRRRYATRLVLKNLNV
jgi:excisionase family DNA binding protein